MKRKCCDFQSYLETAIIIYVTSKRNKFQRKLFLKSEQKHQIDENCVNEWLLFNFYFFYWFSDLKRSLSSRIYSCTYQGIILLTCQYNAFWAIINYYNTWFIKKDCSYKISCGIQFTGCCLEHNLKKEKKSYVFCSSAGPTTNRGRGLLHSIFLKSYFCHWGFPGNLLWCLCLKHRKYSWYIHFHNLGGGPVCPFLCTFLKFQI